MSCIPEKPCSGWDLPPGCCNICEDNEPLLARMWDIAVSIVWRATCWRFPGCCDVETRPCRPCGCDCSCSACKGPTRRIPIGQNSEWCYPIKLDPATGRPLVDVVVNGEIQTGWELTPDRQFLEYCGPEGWPAQDLCNDLGAPGTWSVRATIGCDPPPDLIHGTARLACELVKECKGEQSCLPDGVKSITRRGLTMDVGGGLAETVTFDNNGFGIPELDVAIRAYQCTDSDIAAHFDPLDLAQTSGYGIRSGGWTWRHVWTPTPVGP